MASKRVCDVCGKDAERTVWVWDGGTQVDPPSGHSEETGGKYDFCQEHLLGAYHYAVGKSPEAQHLWAKFLTEKLGRRWKGEGK